MTELDVLQTESQKCLPWHAAWRGKCLKSLIFYTLFHMRWTQMQEESREIITHKLSGGIASFWKFHLNIPNFELPFLHFLSIWPSPIWKIILTKENLRCEGEAPRQREPWHLREKSSKCRKHPGAGTSVGGHTDNPTMRTGVDVTQPGFNDEL